MSVMKTIFEDYLERRLRASPDLNVDREKSARMGKLEKDLSMSEEQKEKFEQLFFEMCGDYQQTAFSDGFRTAFDLMYEVVGTEHEL